MGDDAFLRVASFLALKDAKEQKSRERRSTRANTYCSILHWGAENSSSLGRESQRVGGWLQRNAFCLLNLRPQACIGPGKECGNIFLNSIFFTALSSSSLCRIEISFPERRTRESVRWGERREHNFSPLEYVWRVSFFLSLIWLQFRFLLFFSISGNHACFWRHHILLRELLLLLFYSIV